MQIRNQIKTDTVEVTESVSPEGSIRATVRVTNNYFHSMTAMNVQGHLSSAIHIGTISNMEITELEPTELTPQRVTVIKLFSKSGKSVTVFLSGASIDDLANAIGCEQMSQQATTMAGELA
jgi:hypothetical protein